MKGYCKYWDGLYFDHIIKHSPETRTFDQKRYHVHDDRYELFYLSSGDITQVIMGRQYKLKKHDLVLVKPGNYHTITIDSSAKYEHFVIVFDPNILGIDNIQYWPRELEVINCQQKPIITDLFKKLDHYYSLIHTDELKHVITLLIKELLYNLGYSGATQESTQAENIHPLISRALTEINANLFTINNIDDIAKKLFVTRGYLYRIFKQELKTTPLKYITEKRLDAAQSLLIQGNSPTQVYAQCGFNDYTTFYRNYVKAFGEPPSK